jgi:[methyl-Co(III) methanol-specific corrinoid protein]:coenzyme M methyltransferase
MPEELNSRERVLKFLRREKVDCIPCFAGMGNVLISEVEKLGWHFGDLHRDPHKMAVAAATTYPATGYECAVVPYDYHLEGESLGSEIEFYEERREMQKIIYPIILHEWTENLAEANLDELRKKKPSESGRIPLVADAVQEVKKLIGEDVVVCAYTLGPYGVAGAVDTVVDLSKNVLKKRWLVKDLLRILADYLIEETKYFRQAGADFVCTREMTCATELLHPEVYKDLIVPPLQRVMAGIDPPLVIHTCGDMDLDMPYFIRTGADFLSVEQKVHIWRARQIMNGTGIRLMGNMDVFLLLTMSKPEDVEGQVRTIINEGVDAVWPACDIWPEATVENVTAMVEACKKYSDPEAPTPGTYWAQNGVWEAKHMATGRQQKFPGCSM